MERFDFQPTSITDLVSTRYFSVPRYQRSYAWQEDEIKDFWSDLTKAIAAGGEYFFGNSVLTENADRKSFSIIDGQQRIATATILNAAIRDIYKQQGEEEIAGAVRQEMICALDTESHEKVARIRLNEIDNPFYTEKFIFDRTLNGQIHADLVILCDSLENLDLKAWTCVKILLFTCHKPFRSVAGIAKVRVKYECGVKQLGHAIPVPAFDAGI